jgi:hypothetical protein
MKFDHPLGAPRDFFERRTGEDHPFSARWEK